MSNWNFHGRLAQRTQKAPHVAPASIDDGAGPFLLANRPLVAEAVRGVVTREAAGLPMWVMTTEHLMAIVLQTGRAKDRARLVMFVEVGIADMDRLRAILSRHSLLEAWAKFENRFLQP